MNHKSDTKPKFQPMPTPRWSKVMYRIRHAPHQQTGDNWCIYPMYDFTHPISDALEVTTLMARVRVRVLLALGIG